MMLTLWIYLVIILFLLKVVINFLSLYELYKKVKTNPEASNSMMFELDVALLIIAIILSALSTGDSFVNRPLSVAGWGFFTLFLSYALLYLFLRWLNKLLKTDSHDSD